MTEQKRPFQIIGGAADPQAAAAELSRLRLEIEARNRQETAIAEFGQAALTGVDPSILLGQACAIIEATLEIDHARALEITIGGNVAVRAALGTNKTFLNCPHDAAEDDAIAMVVSLADGPVTFSNLEHEIRFKCSHLRDYHGVQSGAGVAIPTASGAFGALLAYSNAPREFREFEIGFMKSIAGLLGEAVERARTEHALKRTETRFKQIIDQTLDAVLSLDRHANVIEWNRQAEATFGVRARDVIGRPFPAAILPAVLESIAAGVPQRRFETTARREGGQPIPVEVVIDPIGSGDEQTFTAFVRDISDRKRAQGELERREQRFRAIVEKSWSGVALLDADVAFTYAGSSTQRLLGYDERELLHTSFLGFVHPRDRQPTRDIFADLLATPNREVHAELRFQHKNGTWIWIEVFGQNLLHDPSVNAIVVNYRDITQRKETEKQLEYQAYYDALTGLPNRLLFRDRVVNAIAQARRHRRGIAVMYLDLDHFKLVNDGLGHSVGDGLLSEVAARLQGSIRASDTISRLGGDEFTILLNDTNSTDAIFAVARKILHSLTRPFRVAGHELFVTASIGISIYPTDGEDVETLLKCADSAMYRAKELGRNQAQLFLASMNERYVRRLEVEQSLHHALERNELDVFYQPIYARDSRNVIAFEALLRWNEPGKGVVEPSEFIQLAEETGLIVPIGAWVLRQACLQLREWRACGAAGLRLSVNISAPQLQQPRFTDLVAATLAEAQLPADALELEITESVAMQNTELTMQVLRDLRRQGVGIAIDDFGTGQSSLMYLKQFPIGTIKIDQAFVRDVPGDPAASAIVSYIINLAHTINLSVIAEGVETEEQFGFLKANGCDAVQGFLFSHALPAAKASELLNQKAEGREQK